MGPRPWKGGEGSRIGQVERLYCDAVSRKAPGDPTGNSKANGPLALSRVGARG